MKLKISILGSLVIALSYGAPPHNVKKELMAEYDGFHRAFKNHEGDNLASFYDPAFEAKGTDGKIVTRKQMIADFTSQMNAVHNVKWTTVIKKLTVNGAVADALIHGHLEAKTPGPDGKIHQMVLDADSFDHWKRHSSGWRIFRTEIKMVKIKIDGKLTGMQ